jgi:tetratricopeptide (TPR) repeat protein
MKRLGLTLLALLAMAACKTTSSGNPYEKPLFYAKYLNASDPLDQRISATVDALRLDPNSAMLHNELGMLLAQKKFPKDAEREFERSVDSDAHFYPAWYNLGLSRAARGEYLGARHAFYRTIHYKPGHAPALFQLGLLEEQRHNAQQAIALYAKAFQINHALLDVRVNPRILDSRLIPLALMEAYPKEHTRLAIQFQPSPAGYVPPKAEAPSPKP